MAEITLTFSVEYAEDEEVESALQPAIEDAADQNLHLALSSEWEDESTFVVTAKSPYLASDELKQYISLPLLAVPGVALIDE